MGKRRKRFSKDSKRRRASNAESSGTAESKCFVAELPHGLIMDILSRLPIKSLFNCKFVCKTWLHLISDPHFAKLHFARPSTTFLSEEGIESTELLFTQIVDVTSKSLGVEKMRFVPNTNLPCTDPQILNSCNGLVCLYERRKGSSNDVVHICNPILGEYITIPLLKEDGRRGVYLAFGFSSVSNQYKVLQTFYLGAVFTTQCQAEIYTAGSGQWRSIGNAPFSIGLLDVNAFLHDSVHWVDDNTENDGFICSFDFGIEQFKRLSMPPASQMHDRKLNSISNVGVFKGCLFIASVVCLKCAQIDIWVMEEYGVKESWSKKFVVGNVDLNDHLSFEPLILLSSGEILMLTEDLRIVHYDPIRKSFEDTRISLGMESFGMTAYRPSFVSLRDIAQGEELKVLRV